MAPRRLAKPAAELGHEFWRHIQQAQLFLVASSLAYTTILSLIPVLAVSFAMFKAFGGMEKLFATIEPIILNNLAEGSSEEVMLALHGFINNTHAAALGAGGILGLILTCMSMLSSAERAINRVWQARMGRSLFQRVTAYWFFITLGPLALSVAVGAATSSDFPLLRYLPGGAGLYLVSVGLFFAIYKWVPHCYVHWRFALISALFTASFWNLAQWAYSFYVSKFVTYNKIYGSLAAIPIILLWIYVAWILVLSGAALGATLQNKWMPEASKD